MFGMSAPDIISALSTIGTCIAALIALFTLLEMKRQRKLEFMPELSPVRGSAYVNYGVSRRHGIYYWSEQKDQKSDILETIIPYTISFHNLGSGVARNVNIKWEFNIENFVEKANSVLSNKENKISISNFGSGFYKIYGGGLNSSRMNIEHANSIIVDHVLPYSASDAPVRITVPLYYQNSVSVFMRCLSLDGGKQNGVFDFEQLMCIKAHVEYSDIHGEKKKSTFLFTPDVVSFSNSEFHCVMECRAL